MVPPSAPADHLLGFDLSIFAKPFDWNQLPKEDAFSFVFIEAARGVQRGDFALHWSAAKNAGLRRGPYQRFISTISVTDHIDAFSEAFAGSFLEDDDLPPVLDIEPDPPNDNTWCLAPADYLLALHDWVDRIATLFQRSPIIYTSQSSWRTMIKNAPDFSTRPLWIPSYEDLGNAPPLPEPWRKYAFWQYAPNCVLYTNGPMADLDIFAGRIAELDALVRASHSA
jgi:GH25 family lysozyme M1 (1,4-beta-N-acetylmuramidase)